MRSQDCACCCDCCNRSTENRNIRRANEAELDALKDRPNSVAALNAFFDLVTTNTDFQRVLDQVLDAHARRQWAAIEGAQK